MKEMNKKAQDMSITTLILLVLGVVVLIVIVLGVTQGFGFFTDIFDQSNVDATVITQKCGQTGVFGGAICTDRIELSNNNYITCGYAASTTGLNMNFTGSKEIVESCQTLLKIRRLFAIYLMLLKEVSGSQIR